MALNSINTNIAAYYAQQNIGKASTMASSSISRLSSGDRIVRAADDVAAMSAGTSLKTNVTTLRMALINTSQGASLLQVADGALSQITDILQRQKAIAVQAGSGSLTSSERSFLNQEFQSLISEIDRLAGQTNFNGVQLLDGSLFNVNEVTTDDTAATAATSTITFASNIVDPNPASASANTNLRLNGVDVSLGRDSDDGATVTTADVRIGTNLSETLTNLVDFLNGAATNTTLTSAQQAALSQATYSTDGTRLIIEQRAGGLGGEAFTIDNSLAVSTALSSAGNGTGGRIGTVSGETSTISRFTISDVAVADTNSTTAVGAGAGLFDVGAINVDVDGNATDVLLYTTVAGDTLDDIVDGINQGTVSHGMHASIIGTAGAYGLQLEHVEGKSFTIDGQTGGSNAVDNADFDSISATQAENASATGSLTLDISNVGYGLATTVATAGNGLGFETGALTINGTTVHTIIGGDTLGTIVEAINDDVATTGVSAYITEAETTRSIQTIQGWTVATTAADAVADADGTLDGNSVIQATANGTTVNLFNAAADSNTSTSSLADIAAFINTNTGTTGYSATITGNGGNYGLEIQNTAGDDFTVTIAAAEASDFTADYTGNVASSQVRDLGIRLVADDINTIVVAGAGAVTNTTVSLGTATQLTNLGGAANDGLSFGTVTASGTVGDSLVSTLSQVNANIGLQFANIADANVSSSLLGEEIKISDGNGGFVAFTFVDGNYDTAAGAFADTHIELGSTLEDTLDNLVATINNYAGPGDYVFNQIEASRDGRTVTIESTQAGNVTERDGSAIQLFTNIASADVQLTGNTLTNVPTGRLGAALSNGVNTGINTNGITNADFAGTVSGFNVTHEGVANRVDIALTVGEVTYTASSVNTNPVGADNVVRFTSEDGGFFDVTLADGLGSSVNSQDDATSFGKRLDRAFSTITFYQERNVDSYDGASNVLTNGTSLTTNLSDYTDGVSITDVSVSPPLSADGDATIDITLNGVVFRSERGIGDGLTTNSSMTFNSLADPNETITLSTGNTALAYSNSLESADLEAALEAALGIGESNGASLSFQVGITSSDTLAISIDTVNTDELYAGATLDVLTQETAAAAADAIDSAIDYVTSVRATVGALQSRFDFAAANVESSIQNQDAARGVLLDTDITAESTAFATAQVQLQAGISVLAQANQLPQNLLKLIG